MDINDIRTGFTVVMFVIFIAIVLWAWSHKQQRRFNEAAQLPLSEPEYPRSEKQEGDTP